MTPRPNSHRAGAPGAPRPGRGTVTAAGGVVVPARIEQWPLDRLKPYARNPRVHSQQQVNRIAASILEFGFTSPILVDAKAGIIAGHGRLLAARKLGLERVPIIELTHLTETQRRAYLLADNKLALDSEWDETLLLEELRALGAESFDISAAGFSDEELRDLERSVREAAAAPNAQPGARAGRILYMLEFDTQAQKDRWSEFVSWLRDRAPDRSLGAALTDYTAAAMKPARDR